MLNLLSLFLLSLRFNDAVNSYGHIKPVSYPITLFLVGPRRAVSSPSDSKVGVILSFLLPLSQDRQLSVTATDESMCT